MQNTLEQIMDDTVHVAQTYEVEMPMTHLMVLEAMRWRLENAGASREAFMLAVLLGADQQAPSCSKATAKGWLRRLMDVVDTPTCGEADALLELARARGLAQDMGWAAGRGLRQQRSAAGAADGILNEKQFPCTNPAPIPADGEKATMFNDPRTIETTQRENLVTTLISTQATEPIPATVNGESVRITGVLTSVVHWSYEDGSGLITDSNALRALVADGSEKLIELDRRGAIAEPEIEQAVVGAIFRASDAPR